MEGKWIKFNLLDRIPGQKTDRYSVVNKTEDVILGWVRWYGPFRQYSFFPNADLQTVYERQCLMDIAKFLNHLMVERKLQKQLIQNG